MILDLIREHKDKIKSLPASVIQLEKRKIEFGDELDSETGYEYLISFADKSAYLVGETTVVEDREDYAQADSWQESHCIDYHQERRTVPCLEVLEKLEMVVCGFCSICKKEFETGKGYGECCSYDCWNTEILTVSTNNIL